MTWTPHTYDAANSLRLDVEGSGDIAVVLVHGGAPGTGSKTDIHTVGDMFVADGFTAVAVNWRSATSYPRPQQDIQNAISWVRSNLPVHKVVTLGVSFGGGPACWPGNGADMVAAWSGVHDPLSFCSNQYVPLVDRQAISKIVCGATSCAESQYRAAGNLELAGIDNPPTFLANSTSEVIPKTQASLLGAALQKLGVKNRVLLVSGDYHGARLTPYAYGPTRNFFKAGC